MKQVPIVAGHGILVGAECRQETIDKIFQGAKRLIPGDGPDQFGGLDLTDGFNFALSDGANDTGNIIVK